MGSRAELAAVLTTNAVECASTSMVPMMAGVEVGVRANRSTSGTVSRTVMEDKNSVSPIELFNHQ